MTALMTAPESLPSQFLPSCPVAGVASLLNAALSSPGPHLPPPATLCTHPTIPCAATAQQTRRDRADAVKIEFTELTTHAIERCGEERALHSAFKRTRRDRARSEAGDCGTSDRSTRDASCGKAARSKEIRHDNGGGDTNVRIFRKPWA